MATELTGTTPDVDHEYRRRTPGSRVRHVAACRHLPGGDTRESTFHLPYPLYVERGEGYRLWDVDGNEYLDTHGNHTSLVHGHAHPVVVAALRQQLERGSVHGAPTPAIVALADHLTGRVPSLEMLRFTSSGTEAVMHAIRAARAFTGRTKILKMEGAYHGSYDATEVSVGTIGDASFPSGSLESEGLPHGVRIETLVAPFNDVDRGRDLVRRYGHELAAVIVEPMMGRGAIPADIAFLTMLREETNACGALLVFDEIQTFRLAYGGAQEHAGVIPDLTTLGKVIGGGFPIGAFGGRSDVLQRYAPDRPGHLSHSGTFNGNTMAMVAGLAALELLTKDEIARINALGDRLRVALQAALETAGVEGTVTGAGSYAWVHFAAAPMREDLSPPVVHEVMVAGHDPLELLHVFFRSLRRVHLLERLQTVDLHLRNERPVTFRADVGHEAHLTHAHLLRQLGHRFELLDQRAHLARLAVHDVADQIHGVLEVGDERCEWRRQ
jgi:glutamate-1-semialdehyde 2,1-aminomutase